MRGKEIQEKVLEYLEKQDWPCTTEDIAKATGISWNTAELHLTKLQMRGKVKFRHVGRQNQWWLDKSYKSNIGK